MPIPDNIKREHIFRAMLRTHREGIPPRREAKDWVVLQDGSKYPCKLLISWANEFANGEELDSNPNVFTTHMAMSYLENLGFTIEKI